MSTACFFVTDLHGHRPRYDRLFETVTRELPAAVFLGGDLLPHGSATRWSRREAESDFLSAFLLPGFGALQGALKDRYPRIFLILGNDDGRAQEADFVAAGERGLWDYISDRRSSLGDWDVYGYAFVPPTPFRLKDWERYDVSRYVDPGCISPEEGYYSVPVREEEKRYATIERDLERLAAGNLLDRAIFLFHTPPYRTNLDRLAGAGRLIDHAPADPYAGSIAVRRFIESNQPRVTLHGHIHESPRVAGSWRDQIGNTLAFSAAHDGPELALVRFSPEAPDDATRELLEV
jgi:Icc-related predicted phosphoesterase